MSYETAIQVVDVRKWFAKDMTGPRLLVLAYEGGMPWRPRMLAVLDALLALVPTVRRSLRLPLTNRLQDLVNELEYREKNSLFWRRVYLGEQRISVRATRGIRAWERQFVEAVHGLQDILTTHHRDQTEALQAQVAFLEAREKLATPSSLALVRKHLPWSLMETSARADERTVYTVALVTAQQIAQYIFGNFSITFRFGVALARELKTPFEDLEPATAAEILKIAQELIERGEPQLLGVTLAPLVRPWAVRFMAPDIQRGTFDAETIRPAEVRTLADFEALFGRPFQPPDSRRLLQVADVDWEASPGDVTMYTELSASRTITLPENAKNLAQITVGDASGEASRQKPLIVQLGSRGSRTYQIAEAFASITFQFNAEEGEWSPIGGSGPDRTVSRGAA